MPGTDTTWRRFSAIYANEVEFTSPFAVELSGRADGTLHGIDELRTLFRPRPCRVSRALLHRSARRPGRFEHHALLPQRSEPSGGRDDVLRLRRQDRARARALLRASSERLSARRGTPRATGADTLPPPVNPNRQYMVPWAARVLLLCQGGAGFQRLVAPRTSSRSRQRFSTALPSARLQSRQAQASAGSGTRDRDAVESRNACRCS